MPLLLLLPLLQLPIWLPMQYALLPHAPLDVRFLPQADRLV